MDVDSYSFTPFEGGIRALPFGAEMKESFNSFCYRTGLHKIYYGCLETSSAVSNALEKTHLLKMDAIISGGMHRVEAVGPTIDAAAMAMFDHLYDECIARRKLLIVNAGGLDERRVALTGEKGVPSSWRFISHAFRAKRPHVFPSP